MIRVANGAAQDNKAIECGLFIDAGPSAEERLKLLRKWWEGRDSLAFVFCGRHHHFLSPETTPLVDTPCPCGRPNHWVIKYSDAGAPLEMPPRGLEGP